MPCYLEIKGTESQALDKKVKENKTMFNTITVNQYRQAVFPVNSRPKMNQIK